MKSFVMICLVFAAGAFAETAHADMRELSQKEVRENVQRGHAMSFSKVSSTVKRVVEGNIVDVRAFEDDAVFYRILIKGTDGKLRVVILNAKSGAMMSSKSSEVKDIMEASKSKSSSSRQASTQSQNRNESGTNNGRGSGGSDNRNSGGGNSGGGNSGGGNSGGGNSGGGNGGGNGGGRN